MQDSKDDDLARHKDNGDQAYNGGAGDYTNRLADDMLRQRKTHARDDDEGQRDVFLPYHTWERVIPWHLHPKNIHEIIASMKTNHIDDGEPSKQI